MVRSLFALALLLALPACQSAHTAMVTKSDVELGPGDAFTYRAHDGLGNPEQWLVPQMVAAGCVPYQVTETRRTITPHWVGPTTSVIIRGRCVR